MDDYLWNKDEKTDSDDNDNLTLPLGGGEKLKQQCFQWREIRQQD
jgi:hypothetical protein